ncbi:restriction endonuclease subunit S [Brachybacterium sp. GCM10030252]|uniref:restriction endonuclease subunit S n=1 Tax=Brachybacterium sp. GCM10030252 TaxID=3273380 RepID=UPI003607F0ED
MTVTAFRDGRVTLRSNRRTDGFTESVKDVGYQGVRDGEVVIHSMDAFAGAIGVSDSNGKMSPVVHIYRTPGDNPEFIVHALRAASMAGFIRALAKGIRERSTSFDRSVFKSMLLPRPPRVEQDKIVAYIDRETQQIDELIAEQRGLVDSLRERRDAVVKRSISRGVDPGVDIADSGVSWIGAMRADAQLVRVRFLADVNTGSGDTQDATFGGDYPFYVRSDLVQRSDRFCFEGAAVLTSGDGAGVGKVFHLVQGGQFNAHQRVYVMNNFRNVIPSYFFYAFSAYFGYVALDGSAKSTVDSVRRHMITNMPIVVPSLDSQRTVAAYLDEQTSRIDALIAESENLITLSLERRAALITAAVTGQIDVRTAA